MSGYPDRLGEASAWFARLRGPEGARALEGFEEWRADPRNAQAYSEIEAIWTLSGGAKLEPVARRRQIGWAKPALAAAMILAVAAFALAIAFHERSLLPQREVAYEGTAGDAREIVLADGSRVTLDGDSRIEVAFGADERAVRLLSGRGRFAVAHDAAHPFVVFVDDRAVVARGTVFDVDVSSGLTVALIEGSVDLERRTTGTTPRLLGRLKPGEKASFAGLGSAPRIAVAAPDPWPSAILAGDGMSLGDLVTATNRRGGQKIALGDERLGSLRVSGGIAPGRPAEMAQALAAALDLRVGARPDGTLVLERTALTPVAQLAE